LACNKITLRGIVIFLGLINHMAENNIMTPIDFNSISRCMKLIRQTPFKDIDNAPNKDEITIIKNLLNGVFHHSPENFPELLRTDISLNVVLDSCANAYFENLLLYIRTTFHNNNYKYLKTKIENTFVDLNLTREQINLLTTYVQRKLFGNEYLPRKKARILKLNNLLTMVPQLNQLNFYKY